MAEQQPSVTDELRKLAELKGSGVLTDDEFAAAKAALLRTLHAAAPAAPLEDATDARVREQLADFKARFAAIGSHTKAPQEARSLLVEAEDFLVHVVGQSRYDSLIQHADEVIELQEQYLEVRREEKQQDPGASARSLFSRGYVSRTQKASNELDESLENLSRRVAGIDFRK